MTLEQRINEDIKSAMMAREPQRLAALRGVKAAILLAKTSPAAHEITDADIIKIMQKLVKQRVESAEVYRNAGRVELAENETAEAAVIEEYLPKKITPEELEKELRAIISETGARAPSDMGKVMGVATKRLSGRADGKAISDKVRELLG